MPNVKVNTKVRHNGTQYEDGDVIVGLSKEQAKQLVSVGDASYSRNEPASTGKEVSRPSKVKEGVKASKSAAERKSRTEKAQDKVRAEQRKKTDEKPPKSDEATQQPENEPADSPEDTETLKPTGKLVDDRSKKSFSFAFAGKKYQRKTDKNGRPRFYEDGGVISKMDYLSVVQKAGVTVKE